MTFDRNQLIADYAQQILDGMDMKTMECLVYDNLIENLSTYSDQTLMEHISEYSPELLGDVPVEEVAQTP
jgi:hypothetical protein